MVAAPRSGAALRRSVGRPGRRGPSRRGSDQDQDTSSCTRSVRGHWRAARSDSAAFRSPFWHGVAHSLRARRPGSRTPTRRTRRPGVRSRVGPRVGSAGARDAAQEGALRVLARFSGASADSAPRASDGADALPERRPTHASGGATDPRTPRARASDITRTIPSRFLPIPRSRRPREAASSRAPMREILLIRSNGNNRLVGASPDPRVD